MKAKVEFNVDVHTLTQFLETLKINGEFPDDVIEKLMNQYIKDDDRPNPNPNPNPDYVKLTEELLTKCKPLAVGQLAWRVLRELLERGVASEWEIGEMQKASGQTSIRKYHIPFGVYCNNNFKTAFPLFITHEKKEMYDYPQQFRKMPFIIGDKKYHLSAQWFVQNREPMEGWIRYHLPKWFERATEDEKNNMIRFIKTI